MKKVCTKDSHVEEVDGKIQIPSSLAVVGRGKYLLVAFKSRALLKRSKMMIFGIKNRSFQKLAVLDEMKKRMSIKRTLAFCQSFRKDIVWVGLCGHVVVFYRFDPESGRLADSEGEEDS